MPFLKGGFSNLGGRQGTDSEQRRRKRELAQRDQLIGEMSVASRTLNKFGSLRLTDTVRCCTQTEMVAWSGSLRLTSVLSELVSQVLL